jgi:hypothetical protein
MQMPAGCLRIPDKCPAGRHQQNKNCFKNPNFLQNLQNLIIINNPKNLKNIKQKKASGKNPGRFA